MQDVLTNYEREVGYANVDPTVSYKLGKSSDVIKERRTMKISVEQGAAAYTENDTIRFKIGGDFIDPESLHFTCEYQQSVANGAAHAAGSTAGGAAAADKARPPNGIAGLIQEVRIRSGTGVELETIRHQNLLHHVLINYSHTPHHTNTIHQMAGGGSKTRINSTGGEVDNVHTRPMGKVLGANGKEVFSFHIISGLLNSGKLLPVSMLRGLVIELVLDTNSNVLCGDGTTAPTYTITNPKVCYDNIVVSESYRKSFLSFVASNGYVPIGFTSYAHQQNQHTSAGQTLQFDRSVSRLKDIISVFRASASVNKEDADSLETYAQLKDTGGNWRYMIGSQSYPVSGVEHPAEAYREALKVFGRHKNCECGNVTFAQFKNGLGIICADLEKSIGVFGSGEKTSANPSLSLVLNGAFEANVQTTNLVCDHFMHHECLLRISNGYVERLI